MASYSINVKQDLAGTMQRHILKTPLVRNNQYAHVFNVEVTNNGVPYPVGSVEANFVQSNGMTVPLDSTYCSSSGNVATVRLPQACYTVPGRAILVINCEADGGITCIAWFDCTVLNGSTENALDPGTIIPSVETLIDRIDEAVESIPADYSQLLASISDNFSAETPCAAGAYVWGPSNATHPGALYRFTSAHSGSWVETDATIVVIGNELNDTVRYTPQVHTDAEKAVARTNMGAAAAADLTALSNSVGTVPAGTTVENQIFSQGTQISTNASNIDALQRQVGTVPTGETVEGQIGDLKSALTTITGNEVCNFIPGKYIAINGDTADINSPVTHNTYSYVVLDCTEGDIFTIIGKGGSAPRLYAFLGAESDGSRPVLEKASNMLTLENAYIVAPQNSEKLVVNITTNQPHLLIVGKHIINVWDEIKTNADTIAVIGKVIKFPNLTDPTKYTVGYKTNTGSTGSNSTYKYTDKFAVAYGQTVYFTTRCRYVCAYNAAGSIVSASGADASTINTYVVPEGIVAIQATFYAADESGFMATIIEGQEYLLYGTPIVDPAYIPHQDSDNSYVALKSKSNYYRVSSDSMAANDYLLIDKKLPVKNDSVLQFSGNITGEFAGIEIGFTNNITASDSTHFKIDSEKIYRITSNPAEAAHGLTISGNLAVTITQTYSNLIVDITCNGGKYHYSNGWAPQNKMMYVKALSAMTDCVLSWTAAKNKKNIVVFGDSYVSYGESRWPYYLAQNNYDDNVTICGYSGEDSEDGYQNFMDIMPVLSSQYVIWAYGMNDHDSGSAANATWKEKIDAVIAYCEKNGITPVLCTIPNVPSYSNNYKNTYVRSFIGTYPVIDFAKAVGSDISSAWYDGMLSSDNVHPTASGAMALYNRAIADFPQLCVK